MFCLSGLTSNVKFSLILLPIQNIVCTLSNLFPHLHERPMHLVNIYSSRMSSVYM